MLKNICSDIKITDLGEGQPLLIINGLYQDRSSWEPLAKKLAEKLRVITFDFPNQGDMPVDLDYNTISKFSGYVSDLMDDLHLDASKTIIMGLSTGAVIIRHMLSEKKIIFKAQFLFSMPTSGLSNFYNQFYQSVSDSFHNGGIEGMVRATMFINFSPLFLNKLPIFCNAISSAFIKRYTGREKAIEALLKLQFEDECVDAQAVHFETPTFIVSGTTDNIIPKSNMVNYASNCTGSNIEVFEIPGGHVFPLEDPEKTAEYMLHKLSVFEMM